MIYFIDSNIFIRYFATEEGNSKVFEDCKNFIELLCDGRFKAVTSHLVFAEVVWVLGKVYKVDKKDILQILKFLSTISNLKMIDKFQTDLSNKFYIEKNVKYIDSLIASVPEIQKKKWVVVSYDKDFDKLKVLRKEPEQVAVSY